MDNWPCFPEVGFEAPNERESPVKRSNCVLSRHEDRGIVDKQVGTEPCQLSSPLYFRSQQSDKNLVFLRVKPEAFRFDRNLE